MYDFSYFFKIVMSLLLFVLLFVIVLHGHVNYTKHISDIFKAMLMHILIKNLYHVHILIACSDNVCLSLNTITLYIFEL